MLGTVISLASGALGGNLAARILPNLNLGTLGNSAAGIAGGFLGGSALGMLGVGGMAGGEIGLMEIFGNVLSGGVGGGVLLAIVGFVKNALGK